MSFRQAALTVRLGAMGILSALALTACAAQELAKRQRQADAMTASCDITNPKVKGGLVQRSYCLDKSLNFLDAGNPDMDLVFAFEARRRQIAAAADGGVITMPDYDWRISQAWSETITAHESRQEARAASDAQRAQAAAAMIRALQPQPYVAQPYVVAPSPLPQQTTCYRAGIMVNCTTY